MKISIIASCRKVLAKVLPIFLFLITWELVARMEIVNPSLFPPPSVVYSALIEWNHSGEFLRDVKESSWRMLLGFSMGSLAGILTGILTGRIKIINLLLNPIIQLFRPLPPVALIPLVIVWFGIGDISKIFSISFAVFFPIWINTHIGASSIPETYLWSARILSSSKLKIALRVLFPAALTYIIAGLRNAISLAFIMVYVTEIAGASSGLGYQISVSHLAYRIDKMVAALFTLGAVGALSDFLFTRLSNFIFPWIRYRS